MIENLQIDGRGPKAHFFHANGYPPGAYQTLLTLLSKELSIECMLLRPHWKNPGDYKTIKSWNPFIEDLINYLTENHDRGKISIGHSIGGNLLIHAALKRPDLFDSIVLLDPTLFTPRTVYAWKFIDLIGLNNLFHPLSNKTRKRRTKFDSVEQMFTEYRRKYIFKNIKDKQLEEYINSITIKKDNKIHLSYDKMFEVQIYNTAMLHDMKLWNELVNLKVKTHIIYAEKSNAFPASTAKKIKKLNSKIKMTQLNDLTHLFPLEKPKLVAKHILENII
tara:strand:- start:3982 stop:4812 length:831 start_codon:yes stop_codon:yes gene_type:complete